MNDGYVILQGDCIEIMATLPESSIDAVVCDPPYGLEFMGKEWDRFTNRDGAQTQTDTWGQATTAIPGSAYASTLPRFSGKQGASMKPFQDWCFLWATEAYRVLKPGGHLLAFGGTRTYHRLACGIEDAGFEIRDSIHWVYGSGFPKSLDVSKAIDKAAGAERTEVVGVAWHHHTDGADEKTMGAYADNYEPGEAATGEPLLAPVTTEAEQWSGWGTALKPGHEPIVVARKPLIGTVVANVLEHGTGAVNIDGCRIDGQPRATGTVNPHAESGVHGVYGSDSRTDRQQSYDANLPSGRWPANLILSHHEDCVEVGTRKVEATGHWAAKYPDSRFFGQIKAGTQEERWMGDDDGTETIPLYQCVSGCPVAEMDEQSGDLHTQDPFTRSRKTEAVNVLHGSPFKDTIGKGAGFGDAGGASRFFYQAKSSSEDRNFGLPRGQRNSHPTVKPVSLMRYLCRLVTPPGGTVLDPFMGSGSCGIAAIQEGFEYVGIEKDSDYIPLATTRLTYAREFLAEPQSLFG